MMMLLHVYIIINQCISTHKYVTQGNNYSIHQQQRVEVVWCAYLCVYTYLMILEVLNKCSSHSVTM